MAGMRQHDDKEDERPDDDRDLHDQADDFTTLAHAQPLDGPRARLPLGARFRAYP